MVLQIWYRFCSRASAPRGSNDAGVSEGHANYPEAGGMNSLKRQQHSTTSTWYKELRNHILFESNTFPTIRHSLKRVLNIESRKCIIPTDPGNGRNA
jgi:hypothetical protein